MSLQNRLYLSTIDPQAADLARQYGVGLELADFCYPPTLEDDAVRAAVGQKMQGISHFWFHAPFGEFCACAIDPMVRDIAKLRYRQALDRALALGVRRIVIHGGFLPHVYFPEWYVEQSVIFWKEFLCEVPSDVTLALENVMEPSPDMLVAIAEGVNDPRFGLCFDAGHANTCISSVPPVQWLAPMQPWLRHVHLHNNQGKDDLHAALGSGSIDIVRFLDELQRLCPQATVTLENPDCAPSLAWLRQHGELEAFA